MADYFLMMVLVVIEIYTRLIDIQLIQFKLCYIQAHSYLTTDITDFQGLPLKILGNI